MEAPDPIRSSRTEAFRQRSWRLETPVGLAAMFVAALLLRLLVASRTGFWGDLQAFRIWTYHLNDVGLRHFYDDSTYREYPPGYLYVLWAIGKISATPSYLLLKLPSILADLGLAWIAGIFASRLAPAAVKLQWPVRGLVVAAVLFNPAVWGLSAVWGQVDSPAAMFVLWALLVLYTSPATLRNEIASFALFAVAFAMKPQSAFVLPVMLYALYRRYLHGRPLSETIDGLLAIAVTGLLSLAVWFSTGPLFGLGPLSLVRFYNHSVSASHHYTSANAFNLWGVFGFWRNDASGENVMTFAGVSAYHIGTLLCLVGIAVALWLAHRELGRGGHEARILTVTTASVTLLAFALLTRVHERYMFVALAVLAPLLFVRPLRIAYVALSAMFVLNLWYPYAFFNTQWNKQAFRVDPWFDWIFGGLATDTWQRKVLSALVTAIVIVITLRGARWVGKAELASALAGPVGRGQMPAAGGPSTAGAAASWGWLVARLRNAPVFRDSNRRESSTWAARFGPIGLVALTCVFGLVVLRGETVHAQNLNDSSFHLQMVGWADGQIGEGRVPLDGWYPYLSLGSSQFHHYQSLPHTLTAYAAHVTGAGDQTAYLWVLYLLLALWPISVYAGARLLGATRWTAAAAAALSPLLVSASGYGFEHGSYIWRGYGVFSQLWGMWLLPLTWGLTWRAVSRGKGYALAALVLALTMASHFIIGYLAVLTVGVWVVVGGRRDFARRVGRAAIVTVGAMLVAAWALVPLLGDAKWTTRSEFYVGTIFNDSYGAHKILGWLLSGRLFDYGRFPIVTLLFAVGVAVCVAQARRDPRARGLLSAFTLSLLLFFGRRTFGSLIDLLPGFEDVQIHRFVAGVHLAGILIAGVGLSWVLQGAATAAGGLAPRQRALAAGVAAAVVAVGVLAPGWTERADWDRAGATMIRTQHAYDATDGRDLDKLVDIVKARGDGRAYAGLRDNWGTSYLINSVPVNAWLADRNADTFGFTFRTIASLSTDVEVAFDETNPAQYEMFNIRYLLLPSDRKPSVPAKLIGSSGRHRLYEVPTTGYLQVVDRAQAVEADRTNLQRATRGFRQSNLASRGIYPGVAFAGGASSPPTFTGAAPPPGAPGRVVRQGATPQDGVFSGTVEASRPAVVLLKASYDRHWTATVDGLPAKPVMMAPSLVGVEVPVGRHVVRFRYAPVDGYPLLLAIGVLTLLGLAIVPRRAAIVRRLQGARGGRNEAPGEA